MSKQEKTLEIANKRVNNAKQLAHLADNMDERELERMHSFGLGLLVGKTLQPPDPTNDKSA